jgi:GT2 family glycosyltransferase
MVHRPSSPSLADLAVVVVLYNSADVIVGCLEALPDQVEVVVVDNASFDDGLRRACASRPDAVTVRSERNLGFGGGCNLGWRATDKPYVAFVNPDVRVRPDTLPVLLERLLEQEHVMVGPALLDGSGVARPCKRHPSPWLDFLGLLPAAARWAAVGWDGKLDSADPVHRVGGPVPCIEGACFVLRRADLEAVGGFDEDFFLYYEEDSLALRLARLGGGAVYEPRVAVVHSGQASTRQVSALAVHHFHRSRIVFYRKRDGDLPGRIFALSHLVALLVTGVAAAVNRALGRRRPITFSDVRHALRGVVAGVTARLDRHLRYGGR